MKLSRIIPRLVMLGIVVLIGVYHKNISEFIVDNFVYNKDATISINRNEYAKGVDYEFVQITSDFVAKDLSHLSNIFYTILDSGEEEFFFYCADEYKSCEDDINKYIIKDNENGILSQINSFVHPYNSYKSVKIGTNNFDKITVTVNKQYSADNIKYINDEIENIKAQIIKDGMSERNKILAFHDYIINRTKYDKEREEKMDDPLFKDSITHTAYGLLETGTALCGGYTDIMAIYLNQLGLKNINISGNRHIWNLVYFDNQWVHIDVTWDDPYTTSGEQLLLHDYFLVSTAKLQANDALDHKYDTTVFAEAK
jgi:hypothetical protein